MSNRWRHRRAMAWISLVTGLLFPVLLLMTDSEQVATIATPFYLFVTGVVGSYIGFATLDDRWNNGSQ